MDFLVKRGRGLDPAVLGWIMATLGIGPGIGKIHFLVDVDSAYYSWLRDDMRVNPSLIHTGLLAGEDALTAGRNDVLCVFPGSYVQSTTALGWDKASTHLLGLGATQKMEHDVEFTNGDEDATPIAGNWIFSGKGDIVKNVCFRHRGAVTNVMGLKISGDNILFEDVHLHDAANTALADGAAVKGTVLDGANQTIFRRCTFGGTEIERTDGAANLWIGPGTCDNLFFYNCLWIADLSAAADADHAFIEFEAAADLAKFMYLENPVFVNCGAAMNQLPDCITVSATLAGEIVLVNPLVVGALDIADNEEKIWIKPEGHDTAGGKFVGIAINPNTA